MQLSGDSCFNILRAVDTLSQAIRETTVRVPIGVLPAKDRWHMLTSILMGHHLIRGHLRPRDLPLDPFQGTLTRLLATLHPAPLPKIKKYFLTHRVARFDHWLIMAMILEKQGALLDCDGNQMGTERAYQRACWVLIRTVVIAIFRMHKVNAKTHATKKVTQIAAQLAEVAGINLQVKQGAAPGQAERMFIRACELAANEGQDNDNPPVYCSMLVLKTESVQKLVTRCRRTDVMRGASIWCAQFLGCLRECVEEWSSRPDSPSLIMLTDADALCSWLMIGDCKANAVAEGLTEHLATQVQSGGCLEFIQRFFPILRPWADEAISQGINLASAMPKCSIEIRQVGSLSALFNSPHESDSNNRMIPLNRESQRDPHTECAYVKGDSAVFQTDPPWWKAGKDKHPLGWCALAWGHVGAMHRLHCQDGLRRRLEISFVRRSVHHGDWLKSWQNADLTPTRLTLVKLDGDKVGEWFGKTPLIERTARSLALTAMFNAMLNSGATKALQAARIALGMEEVDLLPIDIMYIGGDDHLYCLPEVFLEAFLKGLASGIKTQTLVDKLQGVSYAAISMPMAPPQEKKPLINEIAAKIAHTSLKQYKEARNVRNLSQEATETLIRKHIEPLCSDMILASCFLDEAPDVDQTRFHGVHCRIELGCG